MFPTPNRVSRIGLKLGSCLPLCRNLEVDYEVG